jgi:hypothetical protein
MTEQKRSLYILDMRNGDAAVRSITTRDPTNQFVVLRAAFGSKVIVGRKINRVINAIRNAYVVSQVVANVDSHMCTPNG